MERDAAARVTASSLRGHIERRHEINHETYRMIFKTVCVKLARAARAGASKMGTDVPTFVFGRPRYDRDRAARYVAAKLRKRGFEVAGAPGCARLSVSWDRRPTRRTAADADAADEDRRRIVLAEPMLEIQERVAPPPLPSPIETSRQPRPPPRPAREAADDPSAALASDIAKLLAL